MLSSHNPGWRRRRTLSYAVLATAASLAIATSSAEAEFTLLPCQGAGIQARGASFQVSAQQGFNQNFHSPGFCDATGPAVAYDGAGSGAGRRALGERTGSNTTGARDPAIRLGASDEPPTPTGKADMERGLDGSGDEGTLHVVPVANGAVTVIVNFPDGCTIPGGHEFTPNGSTDTTDRTVRFETTNALWEAAFAGDSSANTWGKLLPGISGSSGGTACSDKPIKRVVRRDSSGTTFAFKDWLNVVNGMRGWSALANQDWPDNPTVIRPPNDGGGALADEVKKAANDGSIGYVDLATARSRSFDLKPSSTDKTLFWVPLRNGSTELVDPTIDPLSYKNGVTGANCTQTVFRNVPASTTGDWSMVSGVGASAGYPVCTLTYDLAFDDNATVYGNTGEEAKARTVKDYLGSIVDNGGQATLQGRDYAPMPASLLTIARGGVSAIGWNKTGGGSGPPGGGGGGGVTPPPSGGGGGTTTPPPSAATASLSIASATVARNAAVTLSARVSGAGTLSGTQTASVSSKDFKSAKNKTLTVAKLSLRVSRAGSYKLVFKPSAKAKRILAKRRKLKVSIKVTFTPASGGGNPVTKTVSLTIKAKKKKK